MAGKQKQVTRPGCLWGPAAWITRLALLVVVGAWAIQTVWGESHWATALVTYAPPLAFLALPILGILVAGLARRFGALLVGLLALGLALAGVARPSLHTQQGLTRTMDSVRVVTWNVHNRVDRLPELRARLTELQPDVVCLQEAYDRKFSDLLPGAKTVKQNELVIVSRLHILASGPVQPEPGSSYRHVPLGVRVAVGRGELAVLNVHLYSFRPIPGSAVWSEALREHTAEAIKYRRLDLGLVDDWLKQTHGPRVVAGDFNTPPRGRLYDRLTHRLTDAFAATGNGFGWSFPRVFPLWRIDYVWVAGGANALTCRTLAVPPSDHYPVVADVDVPRGAKSP